MGDDLKRWWANVRRQRRSDFKIGDVNKLKEGLYVWALKDINFEVQQGECWGL
jgi:lipopolysaccharide transport system ATP-binding protein